MSRRKYVKPAYLKRRLEALRLEFRHSIDEARAATARKVAGIGDSLLSVIKQVDSSITDLNVRLGKLDEHADAVESFMAGSQKQALEQDMQIYARLTKLERSVTTLTDQLSL